MKIELKENMYVRTKDGIIDKVIIDYNGHCASPNCECKHISCAKNYYDEDKVAKASYNIIDILEEGDYVNGQKIYYDEELDFLYVQSFDGDGEFYQESITKQSFIDNIKSVITHEQMEQMAYKVGE